MEVRDINKDAAWYASYTEEQGKGLIFCQQKKIKQLNSLIETVAAEIELAEEPKEYSAETILQSIRALIAQPQTVEHTEGYFKWVG